MPDRRWLWLALAGGVAAGAVWLSPTPAGLPGLDDVADAVRTAGPVGPAIYIAVYALATVALAPGGALTVLAGLLFGPLVGTVVAVVGAGVGATLAFGVARRLGRARTRRLLGDRLRRVDGWLSARGFAAMLTLRLVPLVPFNVLNYAAGLTGIRPRAYVVATLLGIVPGAFAYAALGGTAADPLSLEFLAATALVLALAGGGELARRRLAHGQASGAIPEPGRGPVSDGDPG